MCGICGVIYFGDGKRAGEGEIQNMVLLLNRRGPDASGVYINGPAGLGHARLSIIDLNTGDQPMFNEDKSKAIVFNGEIYNFRELKADLKKKGHVFRTASDTEVILHLYEEKGERCVDDLRGMFAFAIYDAKENTIFAARDRLGKKPFYYYIDGEKFIFASEIKSILTHSIDTDYDLCAIRSFFAYQFIEAPRTIYKSIRKLPAACRLTLKGRDAAIDSYWEIPLPVVEDKGFSYYSGRLVELIHESVRLRLISDVPLGAFLSGGVDSSIIASVMKHEAKDEVKTFSIGFAEKTYDERSYAREVAAKLKTVHTEYEVSYDIYDYLENVLPYFDEPFGDGSSIGTHYLSRMTRQNVTVALSGDGGDELFAGYNRYLAARFARFYLGVPAFFRKRVLAAFIKMLPEGTGYYGRSMLKKLKLFVDFAERISADPLLVLTTPFPPDELGALFSEEFKARLKEEKCRNNIDEVSEKYSRLDMIEHMMYTDINTYLPEDILVKVDMMSMYNSLEVRAPFLDHKFVEFVSTVPLKYKLCGSSQKHILKESFAGIIPDSVLKRKKQGFMSPVSEWLKGELKDVAREAIFDTGIGAKPGFAVFDDKYLKRIFDEHCEKRIDHGLKLWLALTYKLAAKL